MKEVYADVIALTGAKFFHITRQLTLSIVGTIITYEIFLIQFQGTHGINESEDDPCISG
jgi:Trehalose receptor